MKPMMLAALAHAGGRLSCSNTGLLRFPIAGDGKSLHANKGAKLFGRRLVASQHVAKDGLINTVGGAPDIPPGITNKALDRRDYLLSFHGVS